MIKLMFHESEWYFFERRFNQSHTGIALHPKINKRGKQGKEKKQYMSNITII